MGPRLPWQAENSPNLGPAFQRALYNAAKTGTATILSNGPRYTDYGEELSVTLSWSSRKTDEADESRRRPLFLSTKHTLSTPSISLDSGGDVPAAHCSFLFRTSIYLARYSYDVHLGWERLALLGSEILFPMGCVKLGN